MLKIEVSKYLYNYKEHLQYHIEQVMNLACVVAGKGRLPSDYDRKNPQQTGCYWYRDGKKFHILPVSNDHFAKVVSETETEIVLKFSHRYGATSNYTQIVETLILGIFPDNVKKND